MIKMPKMAALAAVAAIILCWAADGVSARLTTLGSARKLATATACANKQNVIPYRTDGTYTVGRTFSVGRTTYTEYCFAISTLQPSDLRPNGCALGNDNLTKVEWSANDSMRGQVGGFSLYSSAGVKTTLPASWGSYGDGVLKAITFSWTPAEANGGRVCVQVKKPYTVGDVCLQVPGLQSKQCQISLFNSNHRCCPTFTASPVA